MGMIATYFLERPIDVIRGSLHVIVGAGRYQTSDVNVQRVMNGYPGVRRVSLEPETPVVTAGGEAGPGAVVPSEIEVRNHVGIQLREKRTGCSTSVGLGSRIAESDIDSE